MENISVKRRITNLQQLVGGNNKKLCAVKFLFLKFSTVVAVWWSHWRILRRPETGRWPLHSRINWATIGVKGQNWREKCPVSSCALVKQMISIIFLLGSLKTQRKYSAAATVTLQYAEVCLYWKRKWWRCVDHTHQDVEEAMVTLLEGGLWTEALRIVS